MSIIKPQAPIVGTGLEGALIRDSRTQIVAEGSGTIDFVDGRRIGFLGSGLMAQGICKGLLGSGNFPFSAC